MLSVLQAQTEQKEIVRIEGRDFYVHKVETGNTLYALSKMYGVKVEDIVSENPQLSEGLKIGQVIRIPVVLSNKKSAPQNTPVAEGDFLIHTVAAKETLYGISRRYNISVEEIRAANGGLSGGLQPDMALRIPRPKAIKGQADALKPAMADEYVQHLVEPGQTLYGLAREYNLNIDSIRILNGGLSEGLKVGTTIRLPLKKEDTARGFKILKPAKLILSGVGKRKKEYTIAVFLPLYLDSNRIIEEKRLPFEKEIVLPQSRVALQFLEGLYLALDSLNRDSVSFRLRIYDTPYDRSAGKSPNIDQLLLDEELVNVDAFIGPFHRGDYEKVAAYANATQKPVFMPTPQSSDLLNSSGFLLKARPSAETQVEQMRRYVYSHYPRARRLLVTNNILRDQQYFERFMGIHGTDTNKEIYTDVRRKFHVVRTNELDTALFPKYLDDSILNLVVVPLLDKSFITSLVTKLNKLSAKNQIIVLGMEKWQDYGFLDYKYLNSVRLHLPVFQFVDYTSTIVDDFVRQYREVTADEPDEWAFLGYDAMMFLGDMFRQYGVGIVGGISGNYYRGLSADFDFVKDTPANGFDNKGTRVVKIENYRQVLAH
jgi:LysM repeat protein